jgi:hypothetical protein
MDSPAAERIAELETELKSRDEKIKELTIEHDEANELVDQMREHVEDTGRTIEQWIEVFDMQQNEAGRWLFDPQQSELWQAYSELLEKHRKLVGQWNKFVGEYNAVVNPRPVGRPIAASAAQQTLVLRQRKAGQPLRAIAAATGLSERTVRTIVAQHKRSAALRRQEFDRHRAAAYRVRQKTREQLPQQIDDCLKTGAALVKSAKGLGSRARA